MRLLTFVAALGVVALLASQLQATAAPPKKQDLQDQIDALSAQVAALQSATSATDQDLQDQISADPRNHRPREGHEIGRIPMTYGYARGLVRLRLKPLPRSEHLVLDRSVRNLYTPGRRSRDGQAAGIR